MENIPSGLYERRHKKEIIDFNDRRKFLKGEMRINPSCLSAAGRAPIHAPPEREGLESRIHFERQPRKITRPYAPFLRGSSQIFGLSFHKYVQFAITWERGKKECPIVIAGWESRKEKPPELFELFYIRV